MPLEAIHKFRKADPPSSPDLQGTLDSQSTSARRLHTPSALEPVLSPLRPGGCYLPNLRGWEASPLLRILYVQSSSQPCGHSYHIISCSKEVEVDLNSNLSVESQYFMAHKTPITRRASSGYRQN